MRIDTVNYLPRFLLTNPDVSELLNAEQIELDKFMNYVELMREQPFINSASIYLSRYERMFGLNVNPTLSNKERIGRILAKLNTRTNSTISAIKTVVSSITGCDTDITEYYDQYKFMLDILRDNSQIINLEDVKEAIEIIKPAHLAFGITMCWKFSIGLKVSTLIYKVAHDVCGDGGNEFDYCGETPQLSYLGNIQDVNVEVNANEKAYNYPYQFTGQYPIVSNLGSLIDENIEISTIHETHEYEYDFSSLETGIVPNISMLGTSFDEGGQIDVEVKNYATPLFYAQEDGDYCGED